jgi:hypothetical protein
MMSAALAKGDVQKAADTGAPAGARKVLVSLIVGVNFLPVPNAETIALVLFGVAAVALVLFLLRERRVRVPSYDLHVAARPTFWVAATGGSSSSGR